jgi:truncated hemoglobin YjbI
MALKKEHFAQWLKLFNETINQNWVGEKANLAKERAYLIGWTIESKMVK